ncbi:hypothetical protein [Lusitaniella coriacea]|uniref:hypothetical protein n=1 Tax=Lusitaniella coriacea TaxID=1983105 RepID=UPI003CED1DCE
MSEAHRHIAQDASFKIFDIYKYHEQDQSSSSASDYLDKLHQIYLKIYAYQRRADKCAPGDEACAARCRQRMMFIIKSLEEQYLKSASTDLHQLSDQEKVDRLVGDYTRLDQQASSYADLWE